MKQLLILSGKGGTGKTTIASAFIKIAQAEVYADCDVDAPNLDLVTQWDSKPRKSDYYGLPIAEINQELCIQCDECRQNCRFDAIIIEEGYSVNSYACEGCGVCEYVCPANAIKMMPAAAGELILYSDNENVFSTAQLKMGRGTSGMLVSEVKKQMKDEAKAKTKSKTVANAEAKAGVDFNAVPGFVSKTGVGKNANASAVRLAILDGSPGIGCPVIASLSGVDMVLIVAEPSISGISDMDRIINTAARFGTKIAVCINKYDTNIENTERIEKYCDEKALPFVGRIPFDSYAVKAINNGQTVVEIDCPSGKAIKSIYNKSKNILFK